MNSGFMRKSVEQDVIKKWVSGLGNFEKARVDIKSCQQGWSTLRAGKSIIDTPLCLAGKQYHWGLGTHADSEIVIVCNRAMTRFRAFAGVDKNSNSVNGNPTMVFSVWAAGKCLAESRELDHRSEPEYFDVALDGVTELTLKIKASATHLAHADWAEADIVTAEGETLRVGAPENSFLANTLPVSFQYNGMESESWFRKWGIARSEKAAKNSTVHSFTCTDTDTGLECTVAIQEFHRTPACLWNVSFTNVGKKTTPVLEKVKTLDLFWGAMNRKKLYRSRGSFHYEKGGFNGEAFRDNFKLVSEDMESAPEINMGGVGGRSSVDWMPYFNFEGDNEGLTFGIGWTGQWHADIRASGSHVHFQAGMENIHTILNPGETISQPSTLMIYWQGDDPIRGHNLLRHFILEELAPRDSSGKTIQPPACNLTWGGMVASGHLARIKNLANEKIPVDYYWIDAGWYGKAGPNEDEFSLQWSSQAGDWGINRDTFPNGFKEISDAAHAIGKKFLLWFEPERAICGTPITQEHPEYFLGEQNPGVSLLLNLGRPEARGWCTELIAGMIETQGIDCYRQDFNFSPLPYWQANDTPERIGMSEIRYIERLYAVLGELRRRFPDLLIDNCASGGRRLDFEMMRYSIPLWASDMQCFPEYLTERNQQLVHGLSYWLPQFAYGTQGHAGDTYHFRSTIAAGVNIHLSAYERHPLNPAYPYQWLRDRLDEYHRAKEFFRGDFYPLFDQFDNMKYWSAFQFHRPDLEAGLLLFFRKSESNIEKMRVPLHGLNSVAYELEDADNGEKFTMEKAELADNGFAVEIPHKRGCRMFFYHVKK